MKIQIEIGRTVLFALTSACVRVQLVIRFLALCVALASASMRVQVEFGLAQFVTFASASMRIQVKSRRAFFITIA